MYAYKNPDKMYLEDQPMLSKIVKTWIENISVGSGDLIEHEVDELECMSRDGFSAASHNCGGFEKTSFTDLLYCYGSGYDYGMSKSINEAVKYYRELADEECKKENITDEEKRYEVQDSYMTETIWLGVRCMYEGTDSRGVHTLMVYCSGNISDYYGPHGKGSETLAEFEIRFRTAASLRRQLSRITKKVESSFK